MHKYYNGYDINIEQNKINGYYKLSAWVETPSDEWLETMTSDNLDEETFAKFVRQCEASK